MLINQWKITVYKCSSQGIVQVWTEIQGKVGEKQSMRPLDEAPSWRLRTQQKEWEASCIEINDEILHRDPRTIKLEHIFKSFK